MEGGAWWATILEVTKSRTRLSDFTFFLFNVHLEFPAPTLDSWYLHSSWFLPPSVFFFTSRSPWPPKYKVTSLSLLSHPLVVLLWHYLPFSEIISLVYVFAYLFLVPLLLNVSSIRVRTSVVLIYAISLTPKMCIMLLSELIKSDS